MMAAVMNHLVADSLADGTSAQDPCPPIPVRPRPGKLNSPCAYLRHWGPSCQASRGWEQDPAVCITPLPQASQGAQACSGCITATMLRTDRVGVILFPLRRKRLRACIML